MSAESKTRGVGSIVRYLDHTELGIISGSSVDYGYSRAPGVIEHIQQAALLLTATDLLALREKDVTRVSQRLVALATRAANHHPDIPLGPQELALFADPATDPLRHELAHTRVLVALRPELVANIQIGVVAFNDTGTLRIILGTFYPDDKADLTPLETAQVLLAPQSPSDQDYFKLTQTLGLYLVDGIPYAAKVTITELLSSRPLTSGKLKTLSMLNGLRVI